MITLQSEDILSKISPVIDEVELMKLCDHVDIKILVKNLDELNGEYDKFMSEIEVTNLIK